MLFLEALVGCLDLCNLFFDKVCLLRDKLNLRIHRSAQNVLILNSLDNRGELASLLLSHCLCLLADIHFLCTLFLVEAGQ